MTTEEATGEIQPNDEVTVVVTGRVVEINDWGVALEYDRPGRSGVLPTPLRVMGAPSVRITPAEPVAAEVRQARIESYRLRAERFDDDGTRDAILRNAPYVGSTVRMALSPGVGSLLPGDQHPVVCLVGSSIHDDAFAAVDAEHTRAGRITIRAYSNGPMGSLSSEQERLGRMKIDMADVVVVINPRGEEDAVMGRLASYAGTRGKTPQYLCDSRP